MVNGDPEAGDPPSDVLSEGRQSPKAMSHAYSAQLTSSHPPGTFSSCVIPRRMSRARSDIFQETDHIPVTFISVSFYDCSILLLIIANLLLCLIYRLNFFISMYV